jgi:pathogenesis-related protein 1
LNDAAGLWYSEVNDYNFDAPVFTQRPQPQVGHFTQIVWLTTKQLGCASAICSGQTLWVCRYVPPGNINVVVDDQVTAATAGMK